RRHKRFSRDWSSDVCSSDLLHAQPDRKATLRRAERHVLTGGLRCLSVAEGLDAEAGRKVRAVRLFAQVLGATDDRGLAFLQQPELGRASCRERQTISLLSRS